MVPHILGRSLKTTYFDIRKLDTSPAAAPTANNWGCESASASSKYVASVSTDDNGVVTVVATGFNNTAIDAQTIQLTPYKDATTTMATTMIGGASIFAWKCGPGASNPMPSKYLPGSCRG